MEQISDAELKTLLDEGFGEMGTALGAVTYMMDNYLRELFPMGDWDTPDHNIMVIKFLGQGFQVRVWDTDCIEVTNEHRIMDWAYEVTELGPILVLDK